MKKLCLLCNQLDESGSFTCLHCGEATWSVFEMEPGDKLDVTLSEEPKLEPKPKRGRK
jgi:hypothetical protein